ncbi:YdeI/OmpD-associated family protein [Octadecabacter sp. G9-8]|uniref:YdeI/OmpD-associated family protein n=1 Tax=Octadecabacter dasysiphoniae TaxID=2909341 RepID=A0ABS9CVI6_9RHOB|nr:YdeI/OmpD-associated family protein [Octadecabacter dasysiphoniae]MCF2870849.1 YdeI/OmpD-associated family protein [Octadecabacter dasysiphoniae]
MAGIPTDRFEKVQVCSAAELRDWLTAHHTQSENVWLVTFKKSVPDKYVSTHDILDEVIAFGWIDGIRRKLDDDRTMQIIGPRQTQAWAKSYKDRAAQLIADGRMTDAGLKSIAASKENGLWDYWADVDALIVPDDLRVALDGTPIAAQNFDQCAPSYRRNLLRWVKLAKTPQTRAKRIAQIVDNTARDEKIPQM